MKHRYRFPLVMDITKSHPKLSAQMQTANEINNLLESSFGIPAKAKFDPPNMLRMSDVILTNDGELPEITLEAIRAEIQKLSNEASTDGPITVGQPIGEQMPD